MGRPSHARSLSVWSNGERVGTWTIPARGDSQFLYDRTWRESPLGRPLSLSLPYTGDIPLRGDVVRDYFDNLLPDSEPIRKRLGAREAVTEAAVRAKAVMDKLAALHDLDMVAGGWMHPEPTGMGRRDVNSSIGGSWNQDGRVTGMDREAQRAIDSGNGGQKNEC